MEECEDKIGDFLDEVSEEYDIEVTTLSVLKLLIGILGLLKAQEAPLAYYIMGVWEESIGTLDQEIADSQNMAKIELLEDIKEIVKEGKNAEAEIGETED